MPAQPRIAVVGSGFAGLETAFCLRHQLGACVDLTVVSDRDTFLFKPNTIYIPFGEDPARFVLPLERPMARKNIRFVRGTARAVDLAARRVETDGGDVEYDWVVLATGAAMRPDEIPGLARHAMTLWTPEEMIRLREAYAALAERAKDGRPQELLFLVPPGNRCSGPLYEMVLMTDTWLTRQGARTPVRIRWATYEQGFIQAFGPRLDEVVTGEFAARGIEGHKGLVVSEVEAGRVRFANGETLPYDLLVGFPPYAAKERFEGLPYDDRGFVRVEASSRRVQGVDGVYAVGDASDFPVKQAFLALLQGDAAAEDLAARIEGRAPKFGFEPVSMCVMEELDKATFAQVPLRYTGDPMRPVEVDTEDAEHYLVGVSPIWRLGKKVLGYYLPWRFGHGEPFHAGFAWGAMDLGLKAMSKALAR